MLKKHLIKIALSLLAGLLLVALIDELRVLVWAWFLVPLYILGTVYGIESLAPKLWALLKTVADKLFMSMIMKSTLGCLIMLIFLPIALTVLLTIGWVSGIVCLVTGLVEAFQEEGGDLAARRSLHRQPKPHQRLVHLSPEARRDERNRASHRRTPPPERQQPHAQQHRRHRQPADRHRHPAVLVGQRRVHHERQR